MASWGGSRGLQCFQTPVQGSFADTQLGGQRRFAALVRSQCLQESLVFRFAQSAVLRQRGASGWQYGGCGACHASARCAVQDQRGCERSVHLRCGGYIAVAQQGQSFQHIAQLTDVARERVMHEPRHAGV